MKEACEPCAYEKVAAVEFRALGEDIHEVKERVARLEQTLARGMALLLANLTGIIVALARQLI